MHREHTVSARLAHFLFVRRSLRSVLELSEGWVVVAWPKDDVDVPTGYDLCHVLPVVARRWTRMRRPRNATLGRGKAPQDTQSPRERWQGSFWTSSGQEGAERCLWLEDLSHLRWVIDRWLFLLIYSSLPLWRWEASEGILMSSVKQEIEDIEKDSVEKRHNES